MPNRLYLFILLVTVAACSGNNNSFSADAAASDAAEAVEVDIGLTDEPADEALMSERDALQQDADLESFCQEIAPLVAPYIDVNGVANKAIGMIIRVETPVLSETCTFGSKEKGITLPPESDSLWVIGSVSKLITAHLLARKAAEGAFSFEKAAYLELPETWKIPQYENGTPFSTLHLLTHSAGLPHYPATLQAAIEAVSGLEDMYAAWEEYREADLINDLAAATLVSAPGTTYLYSDFGFVLAQIIAEKIYAKPYAAIITEFAAALGLFNTTAPEQLSEAQKQKLFYGHAGPQLVPATRPLVNPIFTGDGFLYADASDLGRLLRFFAAIDKTDETTAKALNLMTKPYVNREVSGVPVSQGLGLGSISDSGYTLYKKNGTSTGTTTAFLWDSGHHIGVAAAANVIPVSEGINAAVCLVFAAAAARSGLAVPASTAAACKVAF